MDDFPIDSEILLLLEKELFAYRDSYLSGEKLRCNVSHYMDLIADQIHQERIKLFMSARDDAITVPEKHLYCQALRFEEDWYFGVDYESAKILYHPCECKHCNDLGLNTLVPIG